MTPKPAPAGEEDRVESELLADGILDQAPSLIIDAAAYRKWQPIPWEGKPVSETILDERR
jgi:hypothetical protein